MDRFYTAKEDDADLFKEAAARAAKNTEKSTNNWMKTYETWAEVRGFDKNLERYEPAELDNILQRFYIEIRKKDGQEYEPDSLKVMLAALNRHLKSKGYTISIIKGREFSSSRMTLKGKTKMLRKAGKGKKPNKVRSITDCEEDILWSCKKLGDLSARTLQSTVWWNLVQEFGLRGRENHYNLKMEDFRIEFDTDGRKYVSFIEGPSSKLRQQINSRMYSTNSKRCPVKHFEIFNAKRPPSLREYGPLYLRVMDKPQDNVWYKTTRMGINSLNSMMKDILKNTPLEKAENNVTHRAQTTVVRKLKTAEYIKTEVVDIDISDDSREDDLDAYQPIDEIELHIM